VAMGVQVDVISLELSGDRAAIRSSTVGAAIDATLARLARD
jgi:hypothetical protein